MSLFLADLAGADIEHLFNHLKDNYAPFDVELLNDLDPLIAYESVGDYGCDSSSFFLFRNRETNELFEMHGSHCSCMGFENQFSLESVTIEYLKSKHFGIPTGGYDDQAENNKDKIKKYINDFL